MPTGDKYGFSQLAKYGHVSGVAAEPAKDTIVTMVYDAATYMDEKLVPENGRVLFVRAKDYPKIILSDEWKGLDNLAGKQLPTARWVRSRALPWSRCPPTCSRPMFT